MRKGQHKGIGQPLAVITRVARWVEESERAQKTAADDGPRSRAYGGLHQEALRPRVGAVREVVEREMMAAVGAAKGKRMAGRLGYRPRANLAPHHRLFAELDAQSWGPDGALCLATSR